MYRNRGRLQAGRLEAARTLNSGQGTVEYALVLGCVAVLLVVGMIFLAGKVEDLFGSSSSPEFRPPVAACDAHYSGACIPSAPPDLDCDDLHTLGVQGEVQIVGSDPHGLDADGDGIACN